MNPAARVAVGFLAVALFMLGTIVVLMPVRGTEASSTWLAPPSHFGAQRVVIAAPTGGVAARAGLRVGDTLDLGSLGLKDFGTLREGLAPNEVVVPVERAGRHFTATLRFTGPIAPIPLSARILTIAMNVFCLALVLLILKGSATNSLDVRLLLGYLVSEIADNVDLTQFAPNGLWWFAGQIVTVAAVTAFLYFALRFLTAVPQRRSPLKPWLERFTAPLVAVYAFATILRLTTLALPAFDVSLGGRALSVDLVLFDIILVNVVLIVPVIDGLIYSGRKQRVQMQWIASTVLFSIGVDLMRAVLLLVTGGSPPWLEALYWPLETVMVVGIAYAVLVHRLVDLEFVFSRAAVFALVSAAVLAIFVAGEWIVATVGDKLLGIVGSGNTLERYSGLIAALVAGLLARPVHRTVEDSLGRVFFARQHRNEDALRRFSREAEVATDPAELLDAAFEVARKHVEGSFVAIFVRDGNAYRCLHSSRALPHPAIAENEPVALRLRKFGEPFELDDGEHEYHQAMFFPMTVVGRLIAFVVCGPKLDRTHYGEREVDTLAQFAQRVGTAYAWLEQRQAAHLFATP